MVKSDLFKPSLDTLKKEKSKEKKELITSEILNLMDKRKSYVEKKRSTISRNTMKTFHNNKKN